jgi:hypothetical protein
MIDAIQGPLAAGRYEAAVFDAIKLLRAGAVDLRALNGPVLSARSRGGGLSGSRGRPDP